MSKIYWHELDELRTVRPKVRPPITMPRRAAVGAGYALVRYLESRALSSKLALENGWYVSVGAGDHFTRIVIPAPLGSGAVYWQARAVQSNVKIRYQSPCASREDALVILYNDEITNPTEIVVTEGPMDALAALEAGPYVAVALMGNNPPIKALLRLGNFLPHLPFICVADSDSLNGMVAVSLHLAGTHNRLTRVVYPSPHKDLALCPKELRADILAERF